MQVASIPPRIPIVFASAAPAGNSTYPFPTTAQTGGLASYPTGFVQANFTPVAAGGIPPWGKDMNGILETITAWLQWGQAGAPIGYDSSFSSSIGGYPNGGIIASATGPGLGWLSTTDNNTSDPDTGGANWSPVVYLASSNRLNAGLSATYECNGNPNLIGIPGTAGTATTPPDKAWDYVHNQEYACSVSGNPATWVAISGTNPTFPTHSVILGTGAPGFNSTGTPGSGTSGWPLLSGGNSVDPAFGQLNLGGSGVTGVAPVSVGGQGNNTLTQNGVLIGNGISPVSAVAPGTSGYVLTANGPSAPPSFQPAQTGTLTLGARTTVIQSGTDNILLTDCFVSWQPPNVGTPAINWQLPNNPKVGFALFFSVGNFGTIQTNGATATILPAGGGNIIGASQIVIKVAAGSSVYFGHLLLVHQGSNVWQYSGTANDA